MPCGVTPSNWPLIVFRVLPLTISLALLPSTAKGEEKHKVIKITGTVVDAYRKPVDTGSIHVSFASDKVGDAHVDIEKGTFTIEKTLPDKVDYPLMVKMTFHVTIGKEKLPPRTIEHL